MAGCEHFNRSWRSNHAIKMHCFHCFELRYTGCLPLWMSTFIGCVCSIVQMVVFDDSYSPIKVYKLCCFPDTMR